MLEPPARHTSLWLHGATGRMGQEIRKACADGHSGGLHLVGGSSRCFEDFSGTGQIHGGLVVTVPSLGHALRQAPWDLLLDFSTLDGNHMLLDALALPGSLRGQAVLIGTTGLGDDSLARWRAVALTHHLRLLIAPNTSVGILLTIRSALLAAGPLSRLGFDIEIVETHHRLKKDAPSGTARFLANTLAASVGGLNVVSNRDHARQPGELGVHAVRGGGVFGEHVIRMIGDGEEITIGHRAFTRSLFAQGALVLGQWLLRQPPGVYGILDVDLKDLGVQ